MNKVKILFSFLSAIIIALLLLSDMNIKYVMLEQVKSDAVPYDGAKVSSGDRCC